MTEVRPPPDRVGHADDGRTQPEPGTRASPAPHGPDPAAGERGPGCRPPEHAGDQEQKRPLPSAHRVSLSRSSRADSTIPRSTTRAKGAVSRPASTWIQVGRNSTKAPIATAAPGLVRGSVTRIHPIRAAQIAEVTFETSGSGTPSQTHGRARASRGSSCSPPQSPGRGSASARTRAPGSSSTDR